MLPRLTERPTPPHLIRTNGFVIAKRLPALLEKRITGNRSACYFITTLRLQCYGNETYRPIWPDAVRIYNTRSSSTVLGGGIDHKVTASFASRMRPRCKADHARSPAWAKGESRTSDVLPANNRAWDCSRQSSLATVAKISKRTRPVPSFRLSVVLPVASIRAISVVLRSVKLACEYKIDHIWLPTFVTKQSFFFVQKISLLVSLTVF